MGTPEWAIPSLKAVIESGIEVSAVFTQPDSKIGRKRETFPSPVKKFALEQNITVHSPENAGGKNTIKLVSSMSPELISVCLRTNSHSSVFRHPKYRLFQSTFFFFTKSSRSITSTDSNCFWT